MFRHLKPKLFTILQEEGYNFKTFTSDLMAGVVVGILSIPMAIAFAIAAGARPEQGLYTAIVAGLIVALFGGSRVQVAGPTGAFIVLIYSTISQFGYAGLALATLLAGFILILLGISKAGVIIKFIPYPVTIGFTSGLAVTIFVGQLPDLLGMHIQNMPKEFLAKCVVIGKNIFFLSPASFLIAIGSIIITILWPKINKKIPGSLVAILITALLVKFFHLPVEIIADRFGSIPNSLPSISLPAFSWNLFISIIPSAIAIALLGGIESLLSAVVADGMIGKRHRSDMELVAQGIANVFSVFFGGIPATGAIARTATNVKNGAKTPFAGIFNVITISLILLMLGQFVALIPIATLAGALAVVAYNMSEWRHFTKLFSSPKGDVAVLLITFFLTVFVDLVTAIEAGVILAAFLFLSKQAQTAKARYIKESFLDDFAEEEKNDPMAIALKNVSKEIEIFEVFGPLFFAAVESFKTALAGINRVPKVLIIRMRYVTSIDATGIRALEDILTKAKTDKTLLLLSGVKGHLLSDLTRAGFVEKIGKGNVFDNIDAALNHANLYLEKRIGGLLTEA